MGRSSKLLVAGSIPVSRSGRLSAQESEFPAVSRSDGHLRGGLHTIQFVEMGITVPRPIGSDRRWR